VSGDWLPGNRDRHRPAAGASPPGACPRARALVPVVVVLLLICGFAVGAQFGSATEQPAANIDLRAEGLLLSRCAVCHSTDMVTQQRLDRVKWDATVKKMMHWGADLSKEEAVLLTDYLSARYHPDVPDQEPVRPGETAEPLHAPEVSAAGRPAGEAGRGEVVYEHNCQACHGSGATGGVGPRLSGNPILGDEDRFWETVLHGRGAMPAWESALGAQDIADVRAWLQTIK
jgi:cytochrome c oxidase cbb3-type subunit 3